MFKVRHIDSGEIHTVYHINGTRFLIWQGVWLWIDMNQFEPLEGQ